MSAADSEAPTRLDSGPPFTHRLKTAAVLGAVGGATALLVMPYAMALAPPEVDALSLPLWAVASLGALQTAILTFVVSTIGLASAHRVGLKLALIEAWVHGLPRPAFDRQALQWAIMLGAAVGTVLSALDGWLFRPLMPHAARDVVHDVAAWKGLLASFYGGITEELLLRLGVMSALVWIGLWFVRRITGDGQRSAGPVLMWISIVLTTLLFGVGHLPATARLWPLTSIVITRALLLNGLAGLLFGYLYWRRGLEYAMTAHFSADIVLHVVLPAFSSI
jgi:hypothetical protein